MKNFLNNIKSGLQNLTKSKARTELELQLINDAEDRVNLAHAMYDVATRREKEALEKALACQDKEHWELHVSATKRTNERLTEMSLAYEARTRILRLLTK